MFTKKVLFSLLCLFVVIMAITLKKPSPYVVNILSNPVLQLLFLFVIYIQAQTDIEFGIVMGIVFVLITNLTSMENFKEKFTELTSPYLPQYFQKMTDKFEAYSYEHHKCDELNGFERADCLSGIIKKVNKEYS